MLEIIIIPQCERELKEFPAEVIEDFLDAIVKLQNGLLLSLPLSRPLSSIQQALHELRLKDKNGIYRVFYFIKKGDAIYIIHAFKKKD
jgi:phage-related protein